MWAWILFAAIGGANNTHAQPSSTRITAREDARAAINLHLQTYGPAAPSPLLALSGPSGLDYSPAAKHVVILTVAQLKINPDVPSAIDAAAGAVKAFADDHALTLVKEAHDDWAGPYELGMTIEAIDAHLGRYRKLIYDPAALDQARTHAAKAIATRAGERAKRIAQLISSNSTENAPPVRTPRPPFNFDAAWRQLSSSITKPDFNADQAAAEFSAPNDNERTRTAIMLTSMAKQLTDADQIKRCISLINTLAIMSSERKRHFFPNFVAMIVRSHPTMDLNTAAAAVPII